MNPEMLASYAARRSLTADEASSEIHRLIGGVCEILANSQQFGYHTHDDIYQTAYLEALKALQGDKYDPAKPLENYLYSHIKNRISNLKRSQYFRYEAPCKCCDAFNPGDDPCDRWRSWYRSNTTKQQLMRPLSLGGDDSIPAPRHDPSVEAQMAELDAYVRERLDPDLLDDYDLLRDEADMPKPRRARVREALRAVLGGSPFDPGDAP